MSSFKDAWRAGVSAMGLGGGFPYEFRRTAVRNLERAGVPRSVAMQLVGHKTESIYRRNAVVPKQDLPDRLKRLAEYRSRLGSEQSELYEMGLLAQLGAAR